MKVCSPMSRARSSFLFPVALLTWINFVLFFEPSDFEQSSSLSLVSSSSLKPHDDPSVIIVGIGIPKAGTNMLDSLMSTMYNKESCNEKWSTTLPMGAGTARDSLYCSHGHTIKAESVRNDVVERLGRSECTYLGTHQDLSISTVLDNDRLLFKNDTTTVVRYATMLRDPTSRLVSGCNYSWGNKCNAKTIVEFAKSDRGYGMPNRMTRMVAGVDPVCSLSSTEMQKRLLSNDTALLAQAKQNLRDRFFFVGILERLSEMGPPLLPVKPSRAAVVVLPKLASTGGSFQPNDRLALQQSLKPYIYLDHQLYDYGVELMLNRLAVPPATNR